MLNNKIHEIRLGGQKVWVSLDLTNPIVRWNVAIGVLQSPLNIKNLDKKITTFFMSSRLKKMTFFELEMNKLELVRFMEFPEKISRLQGLFFFEDPKEFEKVKHLPPFNRGQLIECSIEPGSYSRHDMNWITYYSCNGDSYPENWYNLYWEGKKCPFSENGVPVWECITNKTILILDTEIRKKLYTDIIKENDAYAIVLQMGSMAVNFGYAIGSCFYRIINEKNHLHIRSFIRFPEDECIEVIKKMSKNPKLETNGLIMLQQMQKYYPPAIGEFPNFIEYDWCVTTEQSIKNCISDV